MSRAEHERRVSSRLTRGVPPDVDKRVGGVPATSARYRDMAMMGATGYATGGIPRSSGGAPKDTDGQRRGTKQSKK